MKNTSKIDFLPSYNYKVKVFGIISLSLSLILLAISTIIRIDINIISWLIAFSLSIISFSKDKDYNSKDILLKYYSFKLSYSFLIGFILAIKLISYFFLKEIEINLTYFLIGVLLIYQICYNILKFMYKEKKIEIVENSFYKSFLNNYKLYSVLIFLSILSLLVMVFFLSK